MINFIGLIGNKLLKRIMGISYATQIIASINTVFWCIYGIMIHSIWLSMGTIIILPLALWTICDVILKS